MGYGLKKGTLWRGHASVVSAPRGGHLMVEQSRRQPARTSRTMHEQSLRAYVLHTSPHAYVQQATAHARTKAESYISFAIWFALFV